MALKRNLNKQLSEKHSGKMNHDNLVTVSWKTEGAKNRRILEETLVETGAEIHLPQNDLDQTSEAQSP